MIEITNGLKDMITSALRYALGRRTYITQETAEFIMRNPDLVDERVKAVMMKDLENYFLDRKDHLIKDDYCDHEAWVTLYKWLGEKDGR